MVAEQQEEPALAIDLDEVFDEDTDPDDPNYENQQLLKKIQKACVTMPRGWRKNPDFGARAGEAPFIHEDGRTSWKNPAREQIQKIMDDAQQEEEEHATTKTDKKRSNSVVATADNKNNVEPRLLKRYRRMIRSGVPLPAVAQRARIDGVDPAVISDLSKDDSDDDDDNTDTATTDDNNNVFLRKYKKMIKSGVPIAAVGSMARREMGLDLQGMEDLLSDLVSSVENEKKTKEEDEKGATHFKPNEDKKKVEFPLGSIGKESHLALLVRKMVLTVKRSHVTMRNMENGASSLVVDIKDLYDALGALRGVQVARNAYNSTCNNNNRAMCPNEVRSKRKPYLELLSSLGIRSPTRPQDTMDIPGLDQLVSYIEDRFKGTLKEIEDAVRVDVYDYDSLSEIYKPGTRVLAKNVFASGIDMICEVAWNRYEQGKTFFGNSRYFRVCFQFLVAVGEHFTVCEFVEGMESFEGRRHIRSMSFVPLSAYGGDDDDAALECIRAPFARRGETYEKCATGANFMAYDKGSFYAKGGRSSGGTGGSDQTAALRTAGRVMVDTQGSYEAGHSLGIASNDLMVTAIKQKYKEYMLHMRAVKQAKGSSDVTTTTTHNDDGMILFDNIPTEYLEMTWPAVVGFSFTSKTWGEVLVDGLSDIRFDDSVFDHLVLPPARKRMVKALVKHSSDDNAFHDVISGKGEGSVFLLYGPPGTGKTLTAEAISEMLHRPLYSVSLGQLGITPAELETKLGQIMHLCSRWDALVLLDEADIFLEKRSSTVSLERNAMVSVMLRLVEYFRGVLFLTSNRIDALDPAFKTRITLALRYEPLGRDARKQIWTNLLSLSGFGGALLRDDDDDNKDDKDGGGGSSILRVEELSEHELNGREIKNAIRLAMALAADAGKPLSQEFLLETIETLNDFNEKMNSAEAY